MSQENIKSISEPTLAKRYNRLLLGEGLFETLLVCDGQAEFAELHWQRMKHSADELDIPFNLTLSDWLLHINEIIRQEHCLNGVLKVILVPLSDLRGLSVSANDCEIIWQVYESKIQKNPVNLISLPWQRDSNNPIYRHKTLSYGENIQAKQYAEKMGEDDVLIFNQQGYILETSVANIFLVITGELYTPCLSLGILPGIMRQTVINKAKSKGLRCIEDNLTRDHISQSQACFLTNSLIGLLPVKRFEQQSFDIYHSIYQLLKR